MCSPAPALVLARIWPQGPGSGALPASPTRKLLPLPQHSSQFCSSPLFHLLPSAPCFCGVSPRLEITPFLFFARNSVRKTHFHPKTSRRARCLQYSFPSYWNHATLPVVPICLCCAGEDFPFWRAGYQSAPVHQFTAGTSTRVFHLHFPVIMLQEANLAVWASVSVLLPFSGDIFDSFGTFTKPN